MRGAAAAVTLPVKLKLLLSYALVVAQLGSVYQIRYPPGYESVTSTLFSPLVLNLFGWIPGLHLRCFGIRGLQQELLLKCMDFILNAPGRTVQNLNESIEHA